MPQVQFFKGTKAKLNTTTLNNGSVYFIPEERRLYIDTPSKRVPIVGGGLECFLHFNTWTTEDNKAISTTSQYYLRKGDLAHPFNLADVLGQDSIIFIGKIYSGSEFSISAIDDVELTENLDHSLSIIPFEFPAPNENRTYYTIGEEENTLENANGYATSSDLWIYLYCPNPIAAGLSEPSIKTVSTATATIYGLDSNETNNQWYRSQGEYKYDLFIEGMFLNQHPFMITLSDDALENYREFFDKHIYIEGITENVDGSIISFSTNTKQDITYQPNFNMTIDIICFDGDKELTNNGINTLYNIYDFIVKQEYTFEFNSALTYTENEDNKILQIPSTEFSNNTLNLAGVKDTDYIYFETFSEDENNQMYMEINLKDNESFTPLPLQTQKIKTNVNTWKAEEKWYSTKIITQLKENQSISIQDTNEEFNLLAEQPNENTNLAPDKIHYYIDESQIYLYYTEDNYDQNIKVYKFISFTICFKNSCKNNLASFIYYLQNAEQENPKYTLYNFISNIETFGDTNEDGQFQINKFKLIFSNDLKYLLGKDVPEFTEAYKAELNKKYAVLGKFSSETCKVAAIQLDNLANLYQTTLYNYENIFSTGSLGWTKIKDIATFEQQNFSNYERNNLRKNNTYYICVKPNMASTENSFNLTQKHLPLIFPLDHREEFNNIIETKIAANGKIYFYANKIPKSNIQICIVDFV